MNFVNICKNCSTICSNK